MRHAAGTPYNGTLTRRRKSSGFLAILIKNAPAAAVEKQMDRMSRRALSLFIALKELPGLCADSGGVPAARVLRARSPLLPLASRAARQGHPRPSDPRNRWIKGSVSDGALMPT
jgi:hypothetical protein